MYNYYQQFDADYSRKVPGEGHGEWKTACLPFEPENAALAVTGRMNPTGISPSRKNILSGILPSICPAGRSCLRLLNPAGLPG